MIDLWISLGLIMMSIFITTFFSMMIALYIWEVMFYGWRRKQVAKRLRLVMRKRRDRMTKAGMFDDDRVPDEEWLIE